MGPKIQVSFHHILKKKCIYLYFFLFYRERFGIVYVDFNNPNRTRTPRLSASWLGCVLNRRKLISLDEFNANRV